MQEKYMLNKNKRWIKSVRLVVRIIGDHAGKALFMFSNSDHN